MINDRIREKNGKREREREKRQQAEQKAMAPWSSTQGGGEGIMMSVRETSLSSLVTMCFIVLYLTDTLMADKTTMKLF